MCPGSCDAFVSWRPCTRSTPSSSCSLTTARRTGLASASRHTADIDVQVVRLSRRFGSHQAISAGFVTARGTAQLSGSRLQEPVELITRFLREWQAGASVVWGVRRTRTRGWRSEAPSRYSLRCSHGMPTSRTTRPRDRRACWWRVGDGGAEPAARTQPERPRSDRVAGLSNRPASSTNSSRDSTVSPGGPGAP